MFDGQNGHYIDVGMSKDPNITLDYENNTDAAMNEINIISNNMLNAIRLNEENGSVGILLAVKALVQLVATPFVTKFINAFGYRIPTVCGTFCLLLASMGKKHSFNLQIEMACAIHEQ